jgi:hypothetical protein
MNRWITGVIGPRVLHVAYASEPDRYVIAVHEGTGWMVRRLR